MKKIFVVLLLAIVVYILLIPGGGFEWISDITNSILNNALNEVGEIAESMTK